jgi:hypothetical protein
MPDGLRVHIPEMLLPFRSIMDSAALIYEISTKPLHLPIRNVLERVRAVRLWLSRSKARYPNMLLGPA